MKFESTTEHFFSAASLVARFVQKQASMPVLSSILITAESGSVVFRATNLECGVEITLPAKVVEGGVSAVPSGTLVGFLSNIRGGAVAASVEGGVMRLKTERASAAIKTIPHEDFPILPRVSAEKSFSLKAGDLLKLFRSVLHCAATSNIKPEQQGVLLYGEVGKLYAVATDSFRLAEKQAPLKSKGSVPRLLVPAKNAAELLRILEPIKGDVEVYYNENQISLQVESVYYTSRLLDGSFPNYQQVVPKDFSTEVIVLKEDLAQALKGLTVFSDKFQQVSLSVDPKGKTLVLASRNSDVGEEECSLKAAVSGGAIKMSFNGKYLGDGLAPLLGENIRMQISGAGRPLLLKDASDDSYFYLAMPMNR